MAGLTDGSRRCWPRARSGRGAPLLRVSTKLPLKAGGGEADEAVTLEVSVSDNSKANCTEHCSNCLKNKIKITKYKRETIIFHVGVKGGEAPEESCARRQQPVDARLCGTPSRSSLCLPLCVNCQVHTCTHKHSTWVRSHTRSQASQCDAATSPSVLL